MTEVAKDPSLKTMQFGGDHYKGMGIEPVQYAVSNDLGPCEFSAVKYLTRHQLKGKETDVKKAMHYCAMILSMQYGINVKMEFTSQATPILDGAADECKQPENQVH